MPPAWAVLADDNPYKSIVDRNAFSLADPPKPVDPSATNPPPSNIKLTGITKLFGKKQALLMVQEPGPGQKPSDSYILGEGERQDQVEVIAIDEIEGSVKVNNAGAIQTLTFDKDGVQDSGGGAGGGGLPPPPRAMSAGNGFANPRVGMRMLPPPPARNFRMPSAPGQQPQQPDAQTQPPPQFQSQSASQPFQSSQAIVNPFQNSRVDQAQAQSSSSQAISPEVQAILIEKARAENADAIKQGLYPPLPPTALTPSENSDSTDR